MEKWQQEGYKSFGDWRRGSEKARRAAKAAAAPAKKAAAPAKKAVAMATIRWRAPQPLAKPSLARAHSTTPSPSLPPAFSHGALPGQLHEAVCVTPRGRRQHRIKHTSPGGTVRQDEYVSPAGVQQLACEHRLACLRRLADTRREETLKMEQGCGSCAACQEFSKEWIESCGLSLSRKGCFEIRVRCQARNPAEVKRSRRYFHQACEQCQWL